MKRYILKNKENLYFKRGYPVTKDIWTSKEQATLSKTKQGCKASFNKFTPSVLAYLGPNPKGPMYDISVRERWKSS